VHEKYRAEAMELVEKDLAGLNQGFRKLKALRVMFEACMLHEHPKAIDPKGKGVCLFRGWKVGYEKKKPQPELVGIIIL
jgi:hypothetical protein